MTTKDAYMQKIEAQLKEWDAQINLLAAKLENAGADAKLRYAEELDQLRAKRQGASEKLRELRNASDEAWEETKRTAEKIWDDLQSGLSSAASKFK